MFWACGALFRADAKKRHSASWGRELRAGEGLRLAGFSSGRRACARGDCPARRCGSVAACCTWIVSVIAVLLQRFAFGSRRLCGSLEMSCVRFTPAVCRISAKQDGLRYLAFLFRAGRDRHSCVLAALFGYLPLWVHFGFGCFFMAISTGLRPESAIRKGTPFSCNVPFAIDL